jgi:L-threonylcarbamoyladenylate synthase
MSKHTRTLAADQAAIEEAAAVLRGGGLVAFPTETVYGLGANALDAAAARGLFRAKGRPAEDPLIVHLASADELPRVARELPPLLPLLAEAFWPGPLTLVLRRAPSVPALISAGRETVAVRVPAHAVAQALLRAAALPIAAPSANRFGHTSPTSAAHVLADLDGRIDLIIDGGPTPIGVESTVLDLTQPTPALLRPGGVSLEALQALLGKVVLHTAVAVEGTAQASPGLLARHYAPESQLWLVCGPEAAARAWIAAHTREQQAAGARVALLLPDEDAHLLADLGAHIEALGPAAEPAVIARRLYAALRAADARRPDLILARDIGEHGIARAIRDRLTRAASGRVVWLS